MKRHFSSPVCREPTQNTSPIDSTNSSGYHSNDVEKCLSPPMPTPNEIRYAYRFNLPADIGNFELVPFGSSPSQLIYGEYFMVD